VLLRLVRTVRALIHIENLLHSLCGVLLDTKVAQLSMLEVILYCVMCNETQ
jgi:hypothetical protein